MVETTTRKVKQLIKSLLQEGIDDMTAKWLSLTSNPPRTPIFYTLTKIHKPTPVGRPIISGCDGPQSSLQSRRILERDPWIVFRNDVVPPSWTFILPESWDESKKGFKGEVDGFKIGEWEGREGKKTSEFSIKNAYSAGYHGANICICRSTHSTNSTETRLVSKRYDKLPEFW